MSVLVFSLFLLACVTNHVYSAVVTVESRSLRVNGFPFYIVGVNYNPVPIGNDPDLKYDYYTAVDQDVWTRDVPLIRNMGANVVRLYGWNNKLDHTDFLDALYNDGDAPIYVALTFWFKCQEEVTNLLTRVNLKSDFRHMVNKYKNHPAVLMWLIGNEYNSPQCYGKSQVQLDSFMTLVEEMAELAHEEDPNHLVALPLDDTNIEDVIRRYDSQLENLDVWAAQLYRGKDFGDFFPTYQNISTKPLFMSEYGLDAFDDRYQVENASMQMEYNIELWKNIANNSHVNVGGAVFAFSDEWWKGREGINDARHPNCPTSTPGNHTNCGMPMAGPDGYSNEEWYGMFSISPGEGGVDTLTMRPVYYSLREHYVALNVNRVLDFFLFLLSRF